MIEQTGLLFQGHLIVQVADALVHGQTPVLVLVQAAVAVQILELEAVHGQDVRVALQITQLGLGVSTGDDGDCCVDLLVAVQPGSFLSESGGRGQAAQQHDQSHQECPLSHRFTTFPLFAQCAFYLKITRFIRPCMGEYAHIRIEIAHNCPFAWKIQPYGHKKTGKPVWPARKGNQ